MTDLLNALLTAAALLAGSVAIRTIEGTVLRPLEPAGAANVLVFVATDCPVSNAYAPEIQRICAAYAGKGVQCSLIYEDVAVTAAAVRTHRSQYRYGGMAAAIDADGQVARQVRASITPEVAVVDRAGAIRYRGRIDNQYLALGRARRAATVHDLQDALDAVLAGHPVAVPETTPIGCFIVPPDMRRK